MQNGNLILAIDDDPDDLELLTTTLMNDDMEITCLTANTAEKGLKLLRSLERMPRVIFLDYNMPGIGGKECLLEIRRNKTSRDIPVMIYSTFATESDIQFFQRWNAVFIKKHTDLATMKSDLMRIIDSYLVKAGRHQETRGEG
jgi:CheY-like chemotaxis protein